MIDTIKLNIPFDVLAQHGINLANSPFMQWMWGQGFITFPMKGNGSYSPRICLRNYYGKRSLNITFSVQKLFYGNNLYEIWEEEGLLTFEKLKEIIFRNIPLLTPEVLDCAVIQEIHFGKNIIFTDHTQPRALIDLIAKAKINKWLTYNQTTYERGWTCLRIFCDEYEISLYDKVHELKNSKSKFDKSKGAIYTKYIDEKRKVWPFEVLRIEVRLKSPKKTKAIWGKNNNQLELNCRKALCHHEPWKVCLSEIWSSIFKASYTSVGSEMTPLEFICALKSLGISHSQDMHSLLWYHLLQQDNPQLLDDTYYTPENSKRRARDKKRYANVIGKISTRKNKLEQISQQINANERFRPSDSAEDMAIIFK
jgi:hypothetical protein